MKTSRKLHKWIAVCAAILLFLTACGGPPDGLKQQVEALDGTITAAQTELSDTKAAYSNELSQGSLTAISQYTDAERRVDSFDKAGAKIDEATKVADERVAEIVDNFSDERTGELEMALADVARLLGEAKELQLQPAQWGESLRDATVNTAAIVRQTESIAADSEKQFAAIIDDTEQAKKSFPAQKQAIDRKVTPFAEWQRQNQVALADLKAANKKEPADYLAIVQSAEVINAVHENVKRDGPVYRAVIGELSVSETHTLLDIRVDSEIEISRTSWDESSDAITDKDYDYPSVPVDSETANYFGGIAPDTLLATFGGFWGSSFGTASNIDRSQWDKLGIDPQKDFPQWHNNAEYYLGGIEDTYCHKVLVVKNGKADSSARPDPATNPCSKYDSDANVAKGIYWVDADELQSDAIGMDIYSKGHGDFADQASTEATPPGMVYVGDPQYGEWNTNNGTSFWVFYGQYRLFSDLISGPNPYHYRSEYNDWNRNYRYQQQPYYSGSGGSPRYGASSPLTSARFPGSAYVKADLGNATVRNAGPVARGGGPGGGGK